MLIHLPVQVTQDSRPGLLSAVPTGLVGLSDPTQDCRPISVNLIIEVTTALSRDFPDHACKEVF